MAAIRIRSARIKKIAQDKAKAEEDEQRAREAVQNGFVGECGCCFTDCPLNRMVHCNGLIEHVSFAANNWI